MCENNAGNVFGKEAIHEAKAELEKRGWRFDERQAKGFFGRRYFLVIASQGERCVIGKARNAADAWSAAMELAQGR
jgi:hypothetical protein